MSDVDRICDAVHSDGVVNHLRSRRVIDGHDVVPSVRSQRLERYSRTLPMLRRVIEHAPGFAGVVSLPGIVVGISVRVLLALEFESLGCARILCRNVQIKLVAQVAHWVRYRRLLDEVITA